MRRLVEVELTRLRWRHAVHWLVLAALVATVLLGALAAWSTRPLSGAEAQRVERAVEREAAQPHVRQSLRDCVRDPEGYLGDTTVLDPDAPPDAGADPGSGIEPGSDAAVRACEDALAPRPEWFGGRPELDLGRQAEESGLALSVVLACLVLLVGTTFAGHDWGTGSVTNQLLVEPRRLRLWTAKAAAVALGAVALTAVSLATFWAGLRLVAATRGLEVTGADRAEAWMLCWRTLLLTAGTAVGCYALTMLVRGTVAALGIVALAVAVLPVVSVLVTGSDAGFGWTPAGNVAAVLDDGLVLWSASGGAELLTAGEGARYLLVLLAAVLVPSALSFRRGDVG